MNEPKAVVVEGNAGSILPNILGEVTIRNEIGCRKFRSHREISDVLAFLRHERTPFPWQEV
jgi:hypothetical protein